MAKQETIRIHRSEVAGATPSLTAGEVAVNLSDRRFFVGGTGGTSDRISFRDETSSVWSFNGQTGQVYGVESIGGCTGAFEITGTEAEVKVLTGINCRKIVIGLPTNVNISYINATGATFTGTVRADRFIGKVDGGAY